MSPIEKEKKYNWIVVGGGISGITIAEILCRGGESVLLIEKNEKLSSETSKVFHEWLHSGSLYTLAPDKLLTLRYLLGATDDLFEFYDGFEGMNLIPTDSGTVVNGSGWFNDERIEFRYKKHLYNPIWASLVSRSINIIDLIDEHDWLRRRAGSGYGGSKVKLTHWFDKIFKQIKNNSDFYCKMSPDLTINSRRLISDILSAALRRGLKVLTDSPVDSVIEKGNNAFVKVGDILYKSENVVICSPDVIAQQLNIPIKTSYAPMAVVENVPENEKSFVELDYNIKKCINLLKKGNGIGQAGGITLEKKEDVDSYLEYIISQHEKRNPDINVVDTYVGLKKELVQKGENRNYLYHINQSSSHIWSIVLGKFSLAFSMAPEFYRRIHHKNPPKAIKVPMQSSNNRLISETSWSEIVTNSRR
tara:strand:- start:532 stop:1785 length:1254 start_codon:yes stop_codon:yes gene_type:complete